MSPEELWSESVGERPHTVWVGERAQKGMAIYLRWGRPSKYAKATVGSVRDSRGRVQRRRVAEALAEAHAKVEELRGMRPSRRYAGPMTLAQGVERAFSDTGCFPLSPSVDRYTRETKRRVDDAVRLLGGGTVLWESVTPGAVRGIWRRIYKEKGDGSGYNKAEKTVTNLLTIAGWLAGEFPDQRFPRGPQHWRADLKAHWTKQGHEPRPKQPRHAEDEIGQLLAHRDQADPRLGLAIDLAKQLRGGQFVRTMRSHCTEDDGHWRIAVPYRSARKRAPVLVLNAHEAAALERTLNDGYLRDLERAYRAGEISDYALFPQGKLRKGFATLKDSMLTMEQSTLVGKLRDLEEVAGVASVKWRGWHGLRRAMSDYYARLLREGKITDPNLLDEVQGWVRGSTMRERVYRDQEDESLRSGASQLRDLRPGSLPDSEG